MRKTTLLLLSTVLIATGAYAGGSIFGGHKHKSVNTNGVYSIGVHICSSLECPDIRIIEGKCDGPNMEKRWGVCVCDAGYVSENGQCKACDPGQYSDGIHGCSVCEEGMYIAHDGDTSCTPCPSDSYCVAGKAYPCPEHAQCSSTNFTCTDGYSKTTTGCVCSDGKYVDEDGQCVDCPDGGTKGKGGHICCKYGYAYNNSMCGYNVLNTNACGCPGSGVLKNDGTTCCSGYYALIPTGHSLACGTQYGYTGVNFACGGCPDGYYASEGECKSCPNGMSTCDDEGHAVTCVEGYYKDGTECHECPTDHVESCDTDGFTCVEGYTDTGTECICPEGTYTIDGVEYCCSLGAHLIECCLREGKWWYFDSGRPCKTCPENASCPGDGNFYCNDGYYTASNRVECAPCPEHVQTCTADGFTCEDGYDQTETDCQAV